MLTIKEMEEQLDKQFNAKKIFPDSPGLYNRENGPLILGPDAKKEPKYSAPPVKKKGPIGDPRYRTPPPQGYDYDALGQLYKKPTPVKLKGDSAPKIDPNYNRNVGYGLKGNIFPTSAEQRAEYDRIYGGTGSANAKAMAKLREMGQEGMVAKRARERYENTPAGRKPEPPVNYTLQQLFGGK